MALEYHWHAIVAIRRVRLSPRVILREELDGQNRLHLGPFNARTELHAGDGTLPEMTLRRRLLIR